MGAFLRKYATGTGSNIAIPMVKAGSSDYATSSDWTPATGDVKVSIDGGSQANITTLPTYTNGRWIFAFSNAELTGKQIAVNIVDSATKAVEDSGFNIETFGHASAMHLIDYTDSIRFGLQALPEVAFGRVGGLGSNILLDSTTNSSGSFGTPTPTTYAFTALSVSAASLVSGGLKGCLFVIKGGTGFGQSPRVITNATYSTGVVVLTFGTSFTTTPDSSTTWEIWHSRMPSLDASLRPSVLDSNGADFDATRIATTSEILNGFGLSVFTMIQTSTTTFTASGQIFFGVFAGLGLSIQPTAGGSKHTSTVVSVAYDSGSDTSTLTITDAAPYANGGQRYVWIYPAPLSVGGGTGLEGASSVTLTWKDASSVVVPNVDFTIVGKGSATANASGTLSFGLDDGTYTVVSTPTDTVLFANATLVVSGTTSQIITGSTTAIDPPSDPDFCTVYGYTRTALGAIVGSKTIEFKLTRTNLTSGVVVHDSTENVVSGSDGLFTVELPKGWVYDVRPSGAGKHQKLIVGTADTQECTVVIA